MKSDNHFRFEEEFHAKDRKWSRKERKYATLKDRSQFKKSDQDQLKKQIDNSVKEKAARGRVIAIKAEGILVASEGNETLCSLRGSLKLEAKRMKNLVAIGDFVHFTDENVIVVIEERRSILSRAESLSRHKQQLIAVNIDQVLITTSVVMPPIKPFLVDRYIIAATKGNMKPVIVINKIDLLVESSPAEREIYREFVAIYQALNIPLFPVSTATGEGIEDLKRAMQGKTSVFSGQSGVGKSSIINALFGTDLQTGQMVEKTSKGTHTTTSAKLLQIEGGGFCVDTPGIKSFGLWNVEPVEVREYFSEIDAWGRECKYPDCTHLNEPSCAVQEAVRNGAISSLRFASYSALMSSLSEEHKIR